MYCLNRTMIWFGASMLSLSVAFAHDTTKGEHSHNQDGENEMAAMMAEMMKYASPGEHHEHIKPLAGRWSMVTKFRQHPEADWNASTGESTIEWMLGGRFLRQEVKSPPSEYMPVPFEGFGLLGYDNFAKKYIAVWLDNFGTGLVTHDGSCDASGKVITLTGHYVDPTKNGAKIDSRWVYKIVNNDKFVFEMWNPDENGKMFLHGEITYTRVK